VSKMKTKWISVLACVATSITVCLSLKPMAQAQAFTVIHAFSGDQGGAKPMAGLTMDRAGNLYGTTVQEGSGNCGTVFKLTHVGSAWIDHTLYAFQGQPDTCNPEANLVIGPDGNLYGTSIAGGTGPCAQQGLGPGCGTVFKLTPPLTICPAASCSWRESVLYSFQGGSDGSSPMSALVFDEQGNIYGTTNAGGDSGCEGSGCGTVFELSPGHDGWTERVLYPFQDLGRGPGIASGVIFDNHGNLYGFAKWGAIDNTNAIVYELVPSGNGWEQSVLYRFTGQGVAIGPLSGLTFDSVGNLYGATPWGCGSVFELSPTTNGGWNFNTIFNFQGDNGCPFGWGPRASLTFDAAGNLFGTTLGGPSSPGDYTYGSIFELTPSNGGWTETSLHDFSGRSDGGYPVSDVVLDTAGNMYGTASSGGTGDGVVWEVTP
jgi:uncharacterized repeat protein (TIGR03803 family)